MKKLKKLVYQQIATSLIHSGFESTDIRMVEDIHVNMQKPSPIECLGNLGQLARVMLQRAESDPRTIETEI